MTRKDLMKLWFKNVDIEKAKKGDEKELNKFRKNLSISYISIQKEKPEIREKLLRGIKAGALQLIANIPIITPSITAFLQTVTSDDLSIMFAFEINNLGIMLSSKIDNLGSMLSSKIDNLGSMLSSKIDNLGSILSSKIDNLGSKVDNLSSKIDNLGSKIDNLNIMMMEMIELQKKMLKLLDERLPKPFRKGGKK